jgi:hypothetical protein
MVFKQILIIVLTDFVTQVLQQFAETAMQQVQNAFYLTFLSLAPQKKTSFL